MLKKEQLLECLDGGLSPLEWPRGAREANTASVEGTFPSLQFCAKAEPCLMPGSSVLCSTNLSSVRWDRKEPGEARSVCK